MLLRLALHTFLAGVGLCLLVGCKSSTIESRRAERLSAYNSLTPENRDLVDKGQIRVGLPTDAVYIAWGPPSEILQSEADEGPITTWLYHGTWLQEQRYWSYREVAAGNRVYLERYPEHDYFPQSYVTAEIIFQNNLVKRWRTLPRPH